MSEVYLGRLDKIQLTESENTDFVLITDVLGGRVKLTPIGARALHKKLGEFLATANDGVPLKEPTRRDFYDLERRVTKLETVNPEES